MKTRILAAVILLPLLLTVVLALPKIFTAILFGTAGALAAYELLHATGLVKERRLVWYAAASAFAVSLWSFYGCDRIWGTVLVLAVFAAYFAEMMASHIKLTFDKISICLAAALVLPYLLTSLVRIHTMDLGRFFILVPFMMAFLPDSGAYFVGMRFGKHKLAPIISPKKTVEGVFGGTASAVLGMLVYALILSTCFDMQVNYLYAVIYGIASAVGSVFGDLCFSVIKRQTGIKDYGKLIPGHGGILDRFDSMMVVAPLAEILLTLLPIAVK